MPSVMAFAAASVMLLNDCRIPGSQEGRSVPSRHSVEIQVAMMPKLAHQMQPSRSQPVLAQRNIAHRWRRSIRNRRIKRGPPSGITSGLAGDD